MAKKQNVKSLKKDSAKEITKLLTSDKRTIKELYQFGNMTQQQLLEYMPASRVARALKTYLKEDVVTRRGGNHIVYYSLKSSGVEIAEQNLGLVREGRYRAQNIVHDAPLIDYARNHLSETEKRNIITEEEQKRMIASHPDYDSRLTYSACDFAYWSDDGGIVFVECEGDKYTSAMIEAKQNTARLLGGNYVGFRARDYWKTI